MSEQVLKPCFSCGCPAYKNEAKRYSCGNYECWVHTLSMTLIEWNTRHESNEVKELKQKLEEARKIIDGLICRVRVELEDFDNLVVRNRGERLLPVLYVGDILDAVAFLQSTPPTKPQEKMEKPKDHSDGDYSYICGNPYCRCLQ